MDEHESPAQAKKRRFSRVSRACVECRFRKIRCSGKQPCEPCEDFNRRCVYSSTKAQRTGGAPRTKILEDRLRRARALISQLQAENPSVRHRAEINAIFDTPPGSPDSASAASVQAEEQHDDTESLAGDLENMMDGQGRFTAAEDNNLAYFGGPSGFTFLQQTQQLFGDDSSDDQAPQASSPHHLALSHLFDSPLPDKQALSSSVSINQLLPSRSTATRLLSIVFEQTHQLLRFLDESWFHQQTDRIYELDPMDYSDSDHDFLPLFFGVVAVGYLFDPQRHKKYGCRRTIDQAMRHFIAARQMIDVTRCHDLVACQTILIFAMFLMSTARLATAHTYIALAAAAAMRMGMHSQTTYGNFTSRQNEARRRIFWTIVKLDIYTGTILGLPGLVNLAHVDQVRPSGSLEDYRITDELSPRANRDKRRMLAASAQYRELLLIIAEMVQRLYPKTEHEAKQVRRSRRMLISGTVINEVERQFKAWRDNLPAALGVTDESDSPALTSTLYELEMAHNLGHILLYRPFLHYLARMRDQTPPDTRQLRCASACIKTSRQAITRSDEMLQQGYLAPAAWQPVYTIFLSIVALIFYLATQKGAPDYPAIEIEAQTGIRILASTSCQDIGSRRCLDVLKVLARRLGHIIQLDIEGIEKQTGSFCQAEMPMPLATGPGPGNLPHTAPSVASSEPYAESPYYNGPPAQMHPTQQMPQPPVLRSNTDASMPATLQMRPSASSQQVPAPYGSQPPPQPLGQPSMMQQRMAATAANAMFLGPGPAGGMSGADDFLGMHASSSSAAATHHAMSADMEVPFSETFAWPFDPSQMASAGVGDASAGGMGGHDMGGAGVSQHSGGSPLTSEDIAAFMMRINPGEEPFL